MGKSDGSSSEEMPSYALPSHTLLYNRYLLVKMLGAGGFGITYMALDKLLNRTVAIKEFFVQQMMFRDNSMTFSVTVSKSTENLERVYRISRRKFVDEARTLANLEHVPGIVRVHDLFEENETVYMVMEYLSGMTLKSFVKKHGKMSFSDLLGRMNPMLDSLHELHQHGIFHRDISPDNIMMSESGALVLFDFGGAKISDNDGESSIILVKSGYSPLEQFQAGSVVGPWIDIYALAATIYYCITGVVPPESIKRVNTPNLLKRPSELGASLNKEQETVLLKAMSLRHGERYQTIPEFKQALNVRQHKQKRSIVYLLIGAAAAVLVAGGAGFALKTKFGKKLLENETDAMTEEGLLESETGEMTEGQLPESEDRGAMTEEKLSESETGGATTEEQFSESETDVMPEERIPESDSSVAIGKKLPVSETDVMTEEQFLESETDVMTEEQFSDRETDIMTEEGRPGYEVITDYNKEMISYEDAAQELSGREDWMERLDSLKQSKEAYQRGNRAVRDGKLQEALEWYEKVIGADSNYMDARKKMDEIQP